jgi:hypothetical protein
LADCGFIHGRKSFKDTAAAGMIGTCDPVQDTPAPVTRQMAIEFFNILVQRGHRSSLSTLGFR